MKTISFPHMGNYDTPIEFMLKKLTSHEVKKAPPITKKTLNLGSKHSPDFVCIPFKYNLGNYMEALDNGANILVQAGGGCRFGYYGEIQAEILKNLGYEFEFCSIANDHGKMNPKSIYKAVKKLNPKLNIFKFSYIVGITLLMINLIDRLEIYIRKNIGFAHDANDFNKTQKQMLNSFSKTKGFINLIFKFFKFRRRFRKIKLNKPKDCLKVGIIGELYTSMEPFSSYNIEIELAKMGVEIDRFTNLTYLLVTKRLNKKQLLRKAKDYVRFRLGADALDNVVKTKTFSQKGYDGIIHTKPFACMPEVAAIPIMSKVAGDYQVPIIFLSFDSQTSEEGIKTRLEAFYDMIAMKRSHNE